MCFYSPTALPSNLDQPTHAHTIHRTHPHPHTTQAGLIEAGVCLLAYFVVFMTNGISPSDLVDFGTVRP